MLPAGGLDLNYHAVFSENPDALQVCTWCVDASLYLIGDVIIGK